MWIESHQSLERHPKMLLLKSEMSWSKNETIGFLHRFWWSVLEFSLDGGTSRLSPTLLSEMFDMDVTIITKALESMKKVGLITKDGYIHDWWDYAGRFIQSKYSHEPERWKAVRDRTLSVRLAHAKQYASHPPPTNLPTIPNLPNQPNVDFFEQLWEMYPNKDGKKQALAHFKASVKSDDDEKNILAALHNYLKSERVLKGFVKNGSTWFNNWKDWINYKMEVKNGTNTSRPVIEKGKYDNVSV